MGGAPPHRRKSLGAHCAFVSPEIAEEVQVPGVQRNGWPALVTNIPDQLGRVKGEGRVSG